MKCLILISLLACIAALSSCDVQSNITKRSVEKYVATPTSVPSPAQTEEPINPADILSIETENPGPDISLHDPQGERTVSCGAYNRIVLNAFDRKLKITGGCRQVMINGDRNMLELEAAAEIITNGHDNDVKYAKFANGKKPIITDNGRNNKFEKFSK